VNRGVARMPQPMGAAVGQATDAGEISQHARNDGGRDVRRDAARVDMESIPTGVWRRLGVRVCSGGPRIELVVRSMGDIGHNCEVTHYGERRLGCQAITGIAPTRGRSDRNGRSVVFVLVRIDERFRSEGWLVGCPRLQPGCRRGCPARAGRCRCGEGGSSRAGRWRTSPRRR